MANIIEKTHRLLLDHLPLKIKKTPSGWASFNCPMCTDTRGRGGIVIADTKISFHCFNCAYRASWSPEFPHHSKRYKALASRLGATDYEIGQVTIEILKADEFSDFIKRDAEEYTIDFKTVALPEESTSIYDLEHNHPVVEYAKQIEVYGLFPLYVIDNVMFRNRLVVPFYYKNQLVGWSGRHINPPSKKVAKYLHNMQPGYIFNIDSSINNYFRKYVVVVEGMMDAIKLDCVAINSNNIDKRQEQLLQRTHKQIILCPDQDKAGAEMLKLAEKNNWLVSYPDWDNCKDAGDACTKYGRLATLKSIIESASDNYTKAKIKSKLFK